MSKIILIFFFFFQAEDGIRDHCVTGVQTCALPISVAKHLGALARAGLIEAHREGRETRYTLTPAPLSDAMAWMTAVGGQWDERLARLAQRALSASGSAPTGSAPGPPRR